MDAPKVMFNEAAVAAWMVENLSEPLLEAANQVAASVPSDHNVKVSSGVGRNGRPFAMVTLAEAKGLASQAKHGTLTRAAASNGLDVRRYTK